MSQWLIFGSRQMVCRCNKHMIDGSNQARGKSLGDEWQSISTADLVWKRMAMHDRRVEGTVKMEMIDDALRKVFPGLSWSSSSSLPSLSSTAESKLLPSSRLSSGALFPRLGAPCPVPFPPSSTMSFSTSSYGAPDYHGSTRAGIAENTGRLPS